MSFWSSEAFRRRTQAEGVIRPFEPSRIKHGAYELSMGPEAYVTSDPNHAKTVLTMGEQVVIPPGQFGLLLTEETVTVPINAIGFISIKSGVKLRGLVNVSGFHVDPGFSGRLIFSVYNAGSQSVRVARGQPLFLLWFSSTDEPCEPHDGDHALQHDLSAEMIMRIQGTVISPAELKKMIDELKAEHEKRLTVAENRITTWQAITLTMAGVIATFLGGLIFLALRFIVKVTGE